MQNMSNVETFLQLTHKYAPPEAYFCLTTIGNSGKPFNQAFKRDDPHLLKVLEQACSEHKHVFFRCTDLKYKPEDSPHRKTTSKNPRGEDIDTLGTSVLYSDVDCGPGKGYASIEAALESLQKYPRAPSLVMKSGHGLQVYWLLDRYYTELGEISSRLKQLCLDLKSDRGGSQDLSRILRVPDSYNIKNPSNLKTTCTCNDPTAHPRVEILSIDESARYSLEEFPVYVEQTEFLDPVMTTDDEHFLNKLRYDKRFRIDIVEAITIGAEKGQRSSNDYKVCCHLLLAGYSPDDCFRVLTHPEWCTGEKYRWHADKKQGEKYVGLTIRGAEHAIKQDPNRFFGTYRDPKKFNVARMAGEVIEKLKLKRFVAYGLASFQDQLGYYKPDVKACDSDNEFPITEAVKRYIAKELGELWSSYCENETLTLLNSSLEPEIATEMGADGWLNCSNGVYNYMTDEFYPHQSVDLSALQLKFVTFLAAPYDPHAPTEPVTAYFDGLLESEFQDAFWEFGGYILQPSRWLKKIGLFYGVPHTGKTTAIDILRAAYGDHNCGAVTLHKRAQTQFASYSMMNKIANIADESVGTTTRDLIDAIKRSASDGMDQFEAKYKNPVEKRATFKEIYATNALPDGVFADQAWYERLLIIEFKQPHAIDAKYSAKNVCTKEFLAGVMNLMLAGLRRIKANNTFTRSAAVLEVAKQHREDVDISVQFIQECTEPAQKQAGETKNSRSDAIARTDGWYSFSDWALSSGYSKQFKAIEGKRNFYAKVEEYFNFEVVPVNDRDSWVGLKLNELGLDHLKDYYGKHKPASGQFRFFNSYGQSQKKS